ncbi:hypothetical protein B0H14DRAFT_2756300, partial [Mycena olivaceomarginata]
MVIEAVKLAMVAIVTRSLGGLACRSRTLPFPPGSLGASRDCKHRRVGVETKGGLRQVACAQRSELSLYKITRVCL